MLSWIVFVGLLYFHQRFYKSVQACGFGREFAVAPDVWEPSSSASMGLLLLCSIHVVTWALSCTCHKDIGTSPTIAHVTTICFPIFYFKLGRSIKMGEQRRCPPLFFGVHWYGRESVGSSLSSRGHHKLRRTRWYIGRVSLEHCGKHDTNQIQSFAT